METANATPETSNNAPQVQQPKGDQLEGKKSSTLTTKQAAAMFKGSILSDTTSEEADKSETDEQSLESTTKRKSGKKSKDQSEQESADNISDAEEVDLEDQEAIDEDAEDQDEDDQSEEDEADDVEEGADEEADDEEAETDAEDEDFHTVIVDGEEMEVTYEELVSGYQRQADYTKKSTELAQQRKELQSLEEQLSDLPQVKEAYQTEAGRFAKNAELVMVALEKGFMPEPPTEELRKTNPAEYLVQKEKHQEALQFIHGLRGEMAQLEKQGKAEHAKAVNDGRVKLLQVQPELQDAKVRGDLQHYILGLGYTEDQMKGEADHRLFELAFKAMKWDNFVERSKKKPAPEKKRPKVMKQRKAREDGSSIIKKKNSEASARHSNERSIKSASAVISQRIQNASRKKR